MNNKKIDRLYLLFFHRLHYLLLYQYRIPRIHLCLGVQPKIFYNYCLLFLFYFIGVNLLIGTEHGLMLLDRSGQGKVYQLISRRRFQQMEVLEGQNILVTISGKKNRVRVYYLSWLKSKILRTDGVSDVSTNYQICFYCFNK